MSIEEVKKKREYSKIPDSIIEKALAHNKGNVKETRAFLRKYFGVFLTNKILKGKGTPQELLQAHKSSQKRNYQQFYQHIKETITETKSIIDLGCGMNGYSYPLLRELYGEVQYLGIDAAGQITQQLNNYFQEQGITKAQAQQEDLHHKERIINYLKQREYDKPRMVFLLQVIDALEGLQNNYSKELLQSMKPYCEYLVISLPTESLGKRKKFSVNRNWILTFLEEHFTIMKDYEESGERIIILNTTHK